MSPILINSLYTAILMVFNKFNVESDRNKLNYLISCFNGCSVKDLSELKENSNNEMINPSNNGSRFGMHLRSICVILNDNSNVLQEEFFPVDRIIQQELNNALKELGCKRFELKPWTLFELAEDYLKVIKKAEELVLKGNYTSLADLELFLFDRKS